jgi:hypothetical protein
MNPTEESRVLLPQLLLTLCLVMPSLIFDDSGTIVGTVFNGSNEHAPVAGTGVILQVQQDGSFLPLAETTTDERGRFAFDGLPLSGDALYLVGATRDEVFHPGERVRLGPRHSAAEVNVIVFDALTDPSPLVARRHDIVIHMQSNFLNVIETILVSNPSSYCYVGGSGGTRPVTLRLQIPSNFEKVTFDKEFYGRRFSLVDGVLMTTVPWPPGERELKFTYVLPIESRYFVWDRPLELPCPDVRMSVVGSDSKSISSNLPSTQTADGGSLIFEHQGDSLPAGHTIRLTFGRLPVRFSTYGRWMALGALVTVVAVVGVAMRMKRSSPARSARAGPHSGRPSRRSSKCAE